MSNAQQRMSPSAYPLAPLLSPGLFLESPGQTAKALEPLVQALLRMQSEQNVSYNDHLQPNPVNPFADPDPNDQKEGPAAQDLALRRFTEHEVVAKNTLFICRQHCKLVHRGLHHDQPCSEAGCRRRIFTAETELCFAHTVDYAMFDAKERYWSLRKSAASERMKKEEEAAASNAGAMDNEMQDPEGYANWYQSESARHELMEAAENLLHVFGRPTQSRGQQMPARPL